MMAKRSWRRGLFRLGAVALLVPAVGLNSCGYRVASNLRLPDRPKTLAVHTLENRTTTYQIEQTLTRALIRKFVERSDMAVVANDADADAVLEGRVTRVTANPVTFVPSGIGSSFLVTLYAAVVLKDRKSGKVLFENNDYIFREQYSINVDVKNFFSELNPALDRIADDFAGSVVTSIVEDF